MLYTWYIHGIFQSYVDVINMVGIYMSYIWWEYSKTFLGLSSTFFLMIYLWYNLNIKRIFMEYHIIIKKVLNKTKTVFYVFTLHMYDIYIWLKYTMCIPCIYHVYTRQVVISQLYTRNIRCLYYIVYTYNILCIYCIYTLHIYIVYQLYIQCIYQICTLNMLCIFIVYAQYVNWIYIVYYAYILHQAADVREEGRVPLDPFHRLRQQSHRLEGY